MRYRLGLALLAALGVGLSWHCLPTVAQEGAAPPRKAAPKGFRKVVPHTEITIPPDRRADDTVHTHKFVELLAELPADPKDDKKFNFAAPSKSLRAMASETTYRHGAWYCEFTFKPLRIAWVDLPNEDGTVERKPVWYLLYRLKNTGKQLEPVEVKGNSPTVQFVDKPIICKPQFMLVATERDPNNEKKWIDHKAYMDRINATALEAIRQKEDPNRKFLNTVEMNSQKIEVSTPTEDRSAWGIALWYDIDPRIDYFKIQVRGLTNGYRWHDPKDPTDAEKPLYKKGEPAATGRQFAWKTLVLRFWRPGDDEHLDEQEIYYGIPGEVDFEWKYM